MGEKTAYFEVADTDSYIFSNCRYEDLIVYTDTASQAVHFGNKEDGVSTVLIRRDDVNVMSSMSVGKSNPNYPLDVYGNTAVDGSVVATKHVISRGLQVRRKTTDSYTSTTLPSGAVAGFCNDKLGVLIFTNSNTPSNYIKFMASNTQVLNISGDGTLTVSKHILPRAAQEYNIGSMTSRFNEGYMNTLTLGTMKMSGDTSAITLPNTVISPTLTMSNWGQTTLFTSNACLGVARSNPTEALDILGNVKISSNAYVARRLGIATSNPAVALEVNTVDAILIPRGTTGERPGAPAQGHIRYNTTLSTFEGYGPGNTWGSLGGVKDTNQDTYITPELVTGSNDDILRFYNSNVETMRLRLSNLEVNVPVTFSKTTALLPVKSTAVSTYVPPSYNITSSNFSIYGQPYGNGVYSIRGSTTYNVFTTYEAAFDQNVSSRWMSAQTFRGVGGTYNSNEVTPAANGSNYTGEWLQVTIPDTIVPTRLRMITGINNATYAVDTFTLLGSSNSGISWKPFLTSSGNTNWPTVANSNLAFAYNITETDTFNTYRVVFFKSYSDMVYVNYVAVDGYVPAPPIPPKLGVGLSNPSEDVDIIGTIKASSNAYIMNRLAVAHSNPTDALDVLGTTRISSNLFVLQNASIGHSNNPTETLDIQGSLKASSNAYIMNTLGVATSNPTEALDIVGNIKGSSNIYAMRRLGIATSNPTESLDILGNLKTSSNAYIMNTLGVATSNPTESLDIIGNIKGSSNIYAMRRLGIATSNPTESLDILGNLKTSSNGYIMNTLGVATSNPTESLDIVGNIKGSSNIYAMRRLGVSTSNPTESLDILGNLKTSSNAYIMNTLGVATSNPTESLDILGNLKTSSNAYIMNTLGVSTSNPTEAVDIIGNIKGSSNIFAMRRLGVATSNPTESLDILGNIKASSNVYVMNNLGVGTSNPSTTLEVNGGAKINSNLEVMGNLTIRGTTTTIDATTVNIQDNIIRINNGAVYNASLQAGLEINRGTGFSNYMLVFDETSQYFRTGQQGVLQTVATRDDSPTNNGVMIYDSTGKKLTACNTLVFNNGNMCIGTSTGDARLQVQCANAADQVVARFTNGTAETVIRPGMRFATSGTQWSTLDTSSSGGTGFWKPVAMASGLAIGTDNTYGQTAPPTRGAIIEGNVGIATTNPTERLHVASGKILASAGQILAYTGDTSVIPGFSWGDDSNTGMYHPAADTIAFANNGSETIRIASTGNVGLGTTNPTERLHVASGKILASTGQILGYTGDTALVPAYSWGDDSNTGVYHPAADTIAFTNNGSETVRIDSSGNVGIGRTNPTVRLDVNGTLNATTLQQNGNSLSTILSSYATTSALSSYVTSTSLSSTLSSYASASSVSGKLNTSGGSISGSLNVSGNLGVGTTNPTAPLHVIAKQSTRPDLNGLYVHNPTNSAGNHAMVTARVGGGSGGNPWFSLDVENVSGWSIGMDNADNRKLKIRRDWQFSTNDVLTITNGNFVGIGTTNPLAPLHVVGSAGGSVEFGTAIFFNVGSTSFGSGGQYGTNWSVRANDHYGGSGFVAISDARIKKDIESIEVDLSKLMKLRPVSYHYKDDIQRGPRKRFGFIAQEVAQVLPETIHKTTDCIPDIYAMAFYNAVDKTLTFSKNVQDIKLQCNDVVQIIMNKSSNNICLCKVINIHIQDDEQSCIVSVEQVSNAEPLPTTSEEVFVFGRQVDDFMNLNYEDALTWAFAQMQAIYKMQNNLIIDLCQRVQSLENIVKIQSSTQ